MAGGYLNPEQVKALGLESPEQDSDYLSPEQVAALGLEAPDTATDAPSDSEPVQKTGRLEALGRGLAQGLTGGKADELVGMVEGGWRSLTSDKSLKDAYREARDESRAAFNKAAQDQEGAYSIGKKVGGVGQAMNILSEDTDEATAGQRPAIADSFRRGVVNTLTLGAADELRGLSEAGLNAWADDKGVLDAYREARDAARARDREASDAHPIAYGTGQVAGVIPTLLIPGAGEANAARVGIALGAAGGLMSSEADLTTGDLDNYKQAALETGMGAALGRIGASKLGGKALAAYGAGQALFSDDMKDSDRVAALTAAGLLGASGASKQLGRLAGRIGNVADEAEGTLLRSLADEHEAGVQKQLDRLTSERLSEAKRVQANADAELKRGRLLDRKAHDEATSAVKAYDEEAGGLTKEAAKEIRHRTNVLRLAQKLQGEDQKTFARLTRELDDAAANLDSLERSADAHRAERFREVATRLDQFERLTGEPLPEKYQAIRQKIGESYRRNSDNVIIDPDESRANYIAGKKGELEAAKAAAEERLAGFKPRSEAELRAAAEKALVEKQSVQLPLDEQYDILTSKGLDVGPRESFKGFDPKARYGLAGRGRPDEPAPLPSSVDRQLADLEARQRRRNLSPEEAITEAGLKAPTRAEAEAAYRAETGIQGTPEEQVQAVVKDARNRFLRGVAREAATGGTLGFGAGAFAGAGVPGAALGGGVKAALALSELTRRDPLTGKFKNPAAVAGVFRAVERVMAPGGRFHEKYGRALERGLKPTQVLFYLDRDPELLRAVAAELEGGE